MQMLHFTYQEPLVGQLIALPTSDNCHVGGKEERAYCSRQYGEANVYNNCFAQNIDSLQRRRPWV